MVTMGAPRWGTATRATQTLGRSWLEHLQENGRLVYSVLSCPRALVDDSTDARDSAGGGGADAGAGGGGAAAAMEVPRLKLKNCKVKGGGGHGGPKGSTAKASWWEGLPSAAAGRALLDEARSGLGPALALGGAVESLLSQLEAELGV